MDVVCCPIARGGRGCQSGFHAVFVLQLGPHALQARDVRRGCPGRLCCPACSIFCGVCHGQPQARACRGCGARPGARQGFVRRPSFSRRGRRWGRSVHPSLATPTHPHPHPHTVTRTHTYNCFCVRVCVRVCVQPCDCFVGRLPTGNCSTGACCRGFGPFAKPVSTAPCTLQRMKRTCASSPLHYVRRQHAGLQSSPTTPTSCSC